MKNPNTKLAGVIGWPVSHSRSPRLHQYWLEKYQIKGAYLPLPVRPDQLQDALYGLKALGFQGVNVTIPHKENVIPFLDHLDTSATRIGAVNTIIIDDKGLMEGHNTDAMGFITHLKTEYPDWQPSRCSTVVLGAGGAARAVLVALQEEGVPEILLLNRTFARAEALAHTLGGVIKPVEWEKRHDVARHADLLINTTALGMAGQEDLDIENFQSEAAIMDIVYHPLQTSLLKKAKEQGCRAIDGLGMLLHQARPGFKAWFGIMPEVTDDLRNYILK